LIAGIVNHLLLFVVCCLLSSAAFVLLKAMLDRVALVVLGMVQYGSGYSPQG